MKVKCEYCGNYLEDTLEKCPTCGATNVNHTRTADDTPKTIDDLKKWYTARNLPAPEITRFFIGVDYKEPKAFGIYKEGSEFVVYKNKADGQRAIRYKGTDEAYAVNEIYMKLKEEILRQKSQNANRQNAKAPASATSKARKKSRFGTLKFILGIYAAVFVFGHITSAVLWGASLKKAHEPHTGYYYNSSTDELYFCCEKESASNQYEWWKYDFNGGDWSSFRTAKFPNNIKSKNATEMYDLWYEYPSKFTGIDIYSYKDYIDAGHHSHPNGNSYYVYDNNVYYYLDDSHSSYGNRNNSGWYVFDDDEWVFYCNSEDRNKLGDDLWYEPDLYKSGSSYRDFYEFTDDEKSEWVTDFDDMDFYASYTENEKAYTNYKESQNNNSYSNNSHSNDTSYDWDSGSSWDSGGGDWDSDW